MSDVLLLTPNLNIAVRWEPQNACRPTHLVLTAINTEAYVMKCLACEGVLNQVYGSNV